MRKTLTSYGAASATNSRRRKLWKQNCLMLTPPLSMQQWRGILQAVRLSRSCACGPTAVRVASMSEWPPPSNRIIALAIRASATWTVVQRSLASTLGVRSGSLLPACVLCVWRAIPSCCRVQSSSGRPGAYAVTSRRLGKIARISRLRYSCGRKAPLSVNSPTYRERCRPASSRCLFGSRDPLERWIWIPTRTSYFLPIVRIPRWPGDV
mmetsp:Transcript_40231/g.106215  ORF Transcript_40231/g.106215 Transcript_40231/m.106215 type:complete len:209 (-) Transcript_40231:45-671(-)